MIKIERPGVGDFARGYDTTVHGLSSHFVWLNRSKESLTLDLKEPDAERILHRLLARADVFVQNLAPGAAERLGARTRIGCGRQYPRLIVCDISGYGSLRPVPRQESLRPADPERGRAAVHHRHGGDAVQGRHLRRRHRRRHVCLFRNPDGAAVPAADGRGHALDVSLFEALGEWMGYPAYYSHGGHGAAAGRARATPTIAPYGPFQSGDGKAVYLGMQNEREWERFCAVVLRRPELATDSRFDSNANRVRPSRASCTPSIDEVFGELTPARSSRGSKRRKSPTPG